MGFIRHIHTSIKDGEIGEGSNLQKMQIANFDRLVTLYDLDVVVTMGCYNRQ